VGTAGTGSASFYGTFDQGGNVWEWNEAVISSSGRGLRGGSWFNFSDGLAASLRSVGSPSRESDNVGFRVASIPEPSTGLLFGLGGLMMLMFTKTSRVVQRPQLLHALADAHLAH
jgi:hypothetical protein